jgi:hypothetical protein
MTHITIEKEKLKQVLDALGQLWLFGDEAAVIANPAISAVKQAFEQPAQVQGPVIAGSLSVRYFRGCKSMTNVDFDYEGDLPEGDYTLYTTPPAPAPVPLTDGQREEIAKGWRGRNWTVGDIIDAIETAHGITKKGQT